MWTEVEDDRLGPGGMTDQESVGLPARFAVLRKHVEAKIGDVVVGPGDSRAEASDRIAQLHPDVAILDIEVPGRTGLGVAAALDTDNRPDIIFLTAYDSHAINAFDLETADYLLKPLRASIQ